MTKLQGKKIILGICGSIAAYKAAFLTRLLIKSGAEVQVLMTPSATKFISPLTLSTLSKRPVYTSVVADEGWNSHVEMGLWADAMLIAPLTATTLSKMALGLCDNIIVATYLSAPCPVFFAPAMDLDMWAHPATQTNIKRLQQYGNHLIPVAHGELASGLVGNGRMAEPETITNLLAQHFTPTSSFLQKKVLITAGPTYEAIDPVRFIGNRSSGKMGLALATAFAERGAQVHLVLGPSRLNPIHPNIQLTRVESAAQMLKAASDAFSESDIAVFAAAVADYRPKIVADKKIKKQSDTFNLELEKTIDIAASLGKIKRKNQWMIGFALETNNELENAQRKLQRKNFDMIVLNSLQDKGAGFAHDTNKVRIISNDGSIKNYPLKPKKEVAIDIIEALEVHINA